MATTDEGERTQRLEARLLKAVWTGRLLAVWCVLLTWQTLDTSTVRKLLHDRNQPLLAGAVVLLLVLAGLWSHGVLWARPRRGVSLRGK